MTSTPVVLITGARKGIGRHLVEHFLAKGALVEGCSRESSDLKDSRYEHHLADVSNESQVSAMMHSIRRRHGGLDIAINSAGIASMNHIMLTPVSTVERILATNVTGTFLVSREAVKLMRKRGGGRIINLGSVASPLKLEGEAIYAASKSAVATLTQILAREVAEYGITCNVIGPVPIDTDLIRGVPPQKIEGLLNRLPVKRLGTLEDVSNVVDFLVDPASSAVTGQVIYLGGA